MKLTRHILTAVLFAVVAVGTLDTGAAENQKEPKAGKPKPYPLKTCIVSGEEINDKGDMKPHVFVHQGQEVKLCCKSCLKDFNKDKAGYMKKIEAASKPAK